MAEPAADRVEFRDADIGDLPAIVRLLADDALGAGRERLEEPLPAPYLQAFEAIRRQWGNAVIVAEAGGEVVGCLQLTLLPGLSHAGMLRAQIEGVRIERRHRGRGLGAALISHAVARARTAGCGLVQLTSDATRSDARRFYERLGFVASHVGMKLRL